MLSSWTGLTSQDVAGYITPTDIATDPVTKLVLFLISYGTVMPEKLYEIMVNQDLAEHDHGGCNTVVTNKVDDRNPVSSLKF